MCCSHSGKVWGRLTVSWRLWATGYCANLFMVVSLINVYFYQPNMFLGWFVHLLIQCVPTMC